MWLFNSRNTRPVKPTRRVPPSRKPRLEALEDRSLLSAGALDPTFGNGAGYVTTSISADDTGRAVLIQPDGKIVATGEGTNASTGNRDFAVARYNADGSLDASFGSGGMAQAIVGNNTALDYGGAALYPRAGTVNDGKIVMAGRAFANQNHNKNSGQFVFGLARFNTNGTLDATFGGGGVVTTFFSNQTRGAASIIVQPDGKIVAVGTQLYNGGAFELARYNTNGSLDTTFGSGGEVVMSFAQFPTITARSLLLEPNGTLIVVGDTNGSAPNDWVLVRYKANGTLDTSFGNQGIVATPLSGSYVGSSEYCSRAAVLYPSAGTPNDGKVVVVGVGGGNTSSSPWELVRYNANGTLDGTFGNGGEEFPQISGNAINVALDASGRPVVAGFGPASAPNGWQLQLARFNVNGIPDATFGGGGLVTTVVGTIWTEGYGVAVYPNAGTANDGKVVVAGLGASSGTKFDFLVARYLPSEPQIGSFTASPSPVPSGSSATLTASNITDGNPGATITQVTLYYFDGSGKKVTLGTGALTSPGVWTITFTVNLPPGTYTLFAQAEDSYGVFGDPIALAFNVQ